VFGYFDSSLFLAILLDEDKQDEAVYIWKSNPMKISSILLKIETNISLLKFYKRNVYKFGINWFNEKKALRKKLLSEVFFNDITESFADVMEQNDIHILANCKSLDAIHLATALDISEKYDKSEVCICSFDKNMLKVAKELGFETI
jgi:predicted nucleic acid-binding protein